MRTEIKSADLSTGVTLEYVEQGKDSGTPVLFLHGLSDSWHSFELVLPHLPDSIRAFALSQRGHGDSSRPEGAYGYREFADDVAAFMDFFNIGAAVVVGHSSGGPVAQRFAIDHSGRALGLVLVSSFFSLSNNSVAREIAPAMLAMEDPVDPDFVREFQESSLSQPVPQDFFETIVQESMKLPARVWGEVFGSQIENDFSDEISKIKAQTLLVWGEKDSTVPRSDQEELATAIEDSQLVVYEGTGHGLHWEEPERFASDLVRFVDTLTD